MTCSLEKKKLRWAKSRQAQQQENLANSYQSCLQPVGGRAYCLIIRARSTGRMRTIE